MSGSSSRGAAIGRVEQGRDAIEATRRDAQRAVVQREREVRRRDYWAFALSGAACTATIRTTLLPIETTKVLMQVDAEEFPALLPSLPGLNGPVGEALPIANAAAAVAAAAVVASGVAGGAATGGATCGCGGGAALDCCCLVTRQARLRGRWAQWAQDTTFGAIIFARIGQRKQPVHGACRRQLAWQIGRASCRERV